MRCTSLCYYLKVHGRQGCKANKHTSYCYTVKAEAKKRG